MKIKVDQQQENYEMTWNRQLFMHCQIWTLAKWPTCPNHSKCKKAKSWNLGMKSSIALSLAKPITDLSATFSSTSINDKGSSSNCELCFTIVPKTFSRKFFMHRKAFDKLDTLSALAFLSPLAQHKVDAADSPKINDSSLTQNENESFAVHTRKGQKQVCPQGWLAAQKCSGTKNSFSTLVLAHLQFWCFSCGPMSKLDNGVRKNKHAKEGSDASHLIGQGMHLSKPWPTNHAKCGVKRAKSMFYRCCWRTVNHF